MNTETKTAVKKEYFITIPYMGLTEDKALNESLGMDKEITFEDFKGEMVCLAIHDGPMGLASIGARAVNEGINASEVEEGMAAMIVGQWGGEDYVMYSDENISDMKEDSYKVIKEIWPRRWKID